MRDSANNKHGSSKEGPSLYRLLKQTGLHLGELLPVLAEEKTAYMFSTISKSKRICQMFSLV